MGSGAAPTSRVVPKEQVSIIHASGNSDSDDSVDQRSNPQPSWHSHLQKATIPLFMLSVIIISLGVIHRLDLTTVFPKWLEQQSELHIVLFLFALVLFDLVPVIGHAVAKPVQIALPLVVGFAHATVLLIVYVFTHTMLALVVGRRLVRDPTRRWIEGKPDARRWMYAIDRAVTDPSGGLRLVVLFRLAPLPEVLASYVLAVTSISVPHYLITAVVEALKSSALTLYIAFNIQQGSRALGVDDGWITIAMLLVAAAVLFAGTRALHAAVQRELSNASAANEVL